MDSRGDLPSLRGTIKLSVCQPPPDKHSELIALRRPNLFWKSNENVDTSQRVPNPRNTPSRRRVSSTFRLIVLAAGLPDLHLQAIWFDVKFYPYTNPGVDPVFAICGDNLVCATLWLPCCRADWTRLSSADACSTKTAQLKSFAAFKTIPTRQL